MSGTNSGQSHEVDELRRVASVAHATAKKISEENTELRVWAKKAVAAAEQAREVLVAYAAQLRRKGDRDRINAALLALQTALAAAPRAKEPASRETKGASPETEELIF